MINCVVEFKIVNFYSSKELEDKSLAREQRSICVYCSESERYDGVMLISEDYEELFQGDALVESWTQKLKAAFGDDIKIEVFKGGE